MALPENYMARLAAAKGDFEAFCALVFGIAEDHEHALHAGQLRYERDATADVNFCLPGNSFGKTELIKRMALYQAWYKIQPVVYDSFEKWLKATDNTLIASYNYPIAKESFVRLENDYKNLETVRVLIARIDKSDPTEIDLTNGSTIRWGSLDGQGKLVEAVRYNRIFVDEVGHIPDISSTFDNILYPRTMGVGGKIHLLGTPKAHSDPYLLEVYEKGRHGDNDFYYSQDGSVFENEFWSPGEKERVLSNPRYVTGWAEVHPPEEACKNLACREGSHPVLTLAGRQVINGEFIISGGYFFNRLHVARLFTWDESWPQPKWEGDSFFRIEPQEGHLYFGAFDLAGNKTRHRKKVGSDPTVGFVIDYTTRPWRVVWYQHIEGGEADWEQKYQIMATVFHDYGMPYLIIDATGQIDSVQEALQVRGVEVEGMSFGGSSNRKFDMLRNIQVILEMEWSGTRGLLRCPPLPRLKYELDHYVIPDDDIQQDCIMALAMDCFHIAQYELPPATAGEVF